MWTGTQNKDHMVYYSVKHYLSGKRICQKANLPGEIAGMFSMYGVAFTQSHKYNPQKQNARKYDADNNYDSPYLR
jgi:hypothetical protein